MATLLNHNGEDHGQIPLRNDTLLKRRKASNLGQFAGPVVLGLSLLRPTATASRPVDPSVQR